MTFRLIEADCVDAMAAMDEASVDAIVTDPPYGLEFMGKEWDRLDAGLPQENVWKGRRGKGGSSIGTDDTKPASRHHVSLGNASRAQFKRCVLCGKRAFSGSPCRCPEPEWVIEHVDGPPSSAISRMQRWHEAWAREAFRVVKADPASALAGLLAEDRERLPSLFKRLLAGHTAEDEVRLLRPDGDLRWLSLRFFPLLQGSDGLTVLAGTTTDVTAGRLGQEEQRRLAARRDAVLGCPALGRAWVGPHGKILESNRVFQDLLGPGGELELEVKPLQDGLLHRGVNFTQAERRYVRRDHQMAWVRLNVSLVRDDAGSLLNSLCLVENLTGHRRAEALPAVRTFRQPSIAPVRWNNKHPPTSSGSRAQRPQPEQQGRREQDREGQGRGMTEPPRGSLSHWIRIQDYKIANYQAVVPSTWNCSPRDKNNKRGPYEESLIGTKLAKADQPLEIIRTIHSFDPCMACAVHIIRPNGEIRKFRVA